MQRSVGNSVRVESTALATKLQNFSTSSHNAKGKDIPLSTHCGKLGHTMDKCYKLHGFPLGLSLRTTRMPQLIRFHQILSYSKAIFLLLLQISLQLLLLLMHQLLLMIISTTPGLDWFIFYSAASTRTRTTCC